jgi:hypothetical protein
LQLTALRFAFGREIEALNFQQATKFDMKNETTINYQAPPDAKRMLADAAILKLEQEVRGWSRIVNNLKKQDAPLQVWKCAANEVSRRVRKINRIKGGFR